MSQATTTQMKVDLTITFEGIFYSTLQLPTGSGDLLSVKLVYCLPRAEANVVPQAVSFTMLDEEYNC